MTTPDDRQIDAGLRGVSLPRNVADGIRGESLFDDAAIDRLLARVDLPAGLADRVRTAAVAPPPRPRPQGTVDLERIATVARPAVAATGRSRFGRRLAAAFKDTLAVVAVLGIMATIVAASGELSRQLAATVDPGVAREQRSAPSADAGPPRPRVAPLVTVPLETAAVRTESSEASDDRALTALAPTAPLPTATGPGAKAGAPTSALAVDRQVVPAVRGAAVGTAPADVGVGSAPMLMRECEVPGESLRRVPRMQGYDLVHEMTHGEQPLVDPAASPALAADSPPLCLHTNSFDRRVYERGETRWTSGLRAEHVLAAMPAHSRPRGREPLHAEPAGVRLELRAVTSLRVVLPRSVLVEVAVAADQPSVPGRQPVNATIVLDRSAGGDPLVWRWMCRGVAAVAAEMTADDRVSLIVGGSVPQLALKAGDAAAVAALADQLERQAPPLPTADLDALVRLAAQEGDPALQSRLIVVAHAATLAHARDDVRTALTAWHAALAECGGEPLECRSAAAVPRFIVVDAAAPAEQPTRQASFGRTPADPVAIRRALVQHVFGRDTLVARQCRLDVSFDPRQVKKYRLVGYRQSAFESLSTGEPAAVDLHRGETARVVYEVFPADGFGKGAVGATVRWRGADDGKSRQAAAVLAAAPAGQPALPAPHLCELQLAVALGDAVGGSPHDDARTVMAARALAARWRARGDVSDFGSRVIECLERATPDRRGPR
jgi:hypothetical protein